MPTYSYRCTACETRLERNVKMDDRNDQNCETCKGPLSRTIDKPGMVWAPTAGGMRT